MKPSQLAGLALGLLACVPRIPPARPIVPDRIADRAGPAPDGSHADGLPPVHTGPAWWPFRAQRLRLSERDTQERDAAISDKQPPERFWDEQTAIESLNLWTALCTECHGGRRRVEDVDSAPAPPPGWGRGEATFFGNARPHARMFAIVHNGGPERDGKPSTMPAWRGTIAREQIWALVYFLEHQSTEGVDGPLPPSLPPRQR